MKTQNIGSFTLANKREFYDYPPSLDRHHADWQWVNTIDSSLHPYVKQCLSGAGLKE